jgi:hypothetical protein
MKRTFKYPLAAFLFVVLSNVPPLHSFYRLFDELIPYADTYATQDRKFVFGGSLKYAETDGYFKRYKLMNPSADYTLYRIRPINVLKFWRWYGFLTEDYWKQPYIEFDNLLAFQKQQSFWKAYNTYYGSLPPQTHKDSVNAANHYKKPKLDSAHVQFKP